MTTGAIGGPAGTESTPSGEHALEPHVIHTSLYRPVLLAGVEPAVAVVEVSTAFALIFGVGLHVATVALAVFYVTAVHAVMAGIAAKDPHMTTLYVRSLGARDFYAPHGGLRAPTPPVRPSIPIAH